MACLAALVVASLLVGNAAVGAGDMVAALTGGGAPAARLVLWQVRMPRVAAALVCGSALAVSGLTLQVALGNDLASPGLMGVNSGAGLAVLLAALVAPGMAAPRLGLAFAGAMLAAALVWGISRATGTARSTLVLVGVAVSSLFSAGIDAIVTVRPDLVVDRVSFTLGGLQNVTTAQVMAALPVLLAALAAVAALSGGLELLPLGDETAAGLGLDVARWRMLAVVASAALAAVAVSLCGVIGFVGLIVPNAVRRMAGSGVRRCAALCLVWGPCLLLAADLAARVLFFPYELPVGLVLSFVGAPFFVWLLARRRRGWRP
jgi:iron complex transport system permease protein